ncbi:hypothetical protein C488_08557 [Natrinema pellirubrum DSM 15624]|uniref:Uncharacterized protein n=1 Tax=Natrinema pellirubrum (strain DSM 15624 / CIP 106293 / JCM 10476 / NCIMB 786 / 157) TaxID=797303 RepID=L0JSL9_NATP1|nr:hypothetical protein [Natrinema pellirubrum]AGB33788.1 hypothetical protein Natpe_4065 [Natrinema pellirubrum DSM 15624]ELY76019.1 hypothetical protein C488_08557 [Natrinema pellirubrum DSM 15624]
MRFLQSVRHLFSIFVYFTAITYGIGILVVSPTRSLLIVPIMTGIGLLSHAVKTTHLDELGYAIMWLWFAVLALVGGGLMIDEFVLVHREIPPVAESSMARVLGTLGLVVVLITVYVHSVQRAK